MGQLFPLVVGQLPNKYEGFLFQVETFFQVAVHETEDATSKTGKPEWKRFSPFNRWNCQITCGKVLKLIKGN